MFSKTPVLLRREGQHKLMADFGLVSGSARFGTYFSLTPVGSATANTKGAYLEVTASLPFDTDCLRIDMNGDLDSASRRAFDISIGTAGSEQVIIPDLMISELSGYGGAISIDVPISIKAGTRVSIRLQSNVASANGFVRIIPIASPFMRLQNLGGVIDVIGFNAASTIGKNLTPANTWVEMIASSAYRYRAFFFGISSAGDIVNHAEGTISIGVGIGGSEYAIIGSYRIHRVIMHDWYPQYQNPIQVDIPAGSRISMKTSTIAAAVYTTLYGVR